MDVGHPEFQGRVAGARDVVEQTDDARPRGWEPHGTQCAGVACAGGVRVSGVAPRAELLAVRVSTLREGLGSSAEAEGIRYAAGHGADVICCAWAPNGLEGGQPLPERTRAAIEWAARHGRGGRGCVVVVPAGNDGRDLSSNGYAAHPLVLAVGACNDRDRRPAYSGWGRHLFCVFPSSDPGMSTPHRSISTTTPRGSFLLGETFYSDGFGFTSAAAAGVAGVCALVLSANPDLTWWKLREVLKHSCSRIDFENGGYDVHGHSRLYGYGKPDAAVAVELALSRRTGHGRSLDEAPALEPGSPSARM